MTTTADEENDADGAAEEFEHAISGRIFGEDRDNAAASVCKGIGSREWDRTTDHLHVKEVLYH